MPNNASPQPDPPEQAAQPVVNTGGGDYAERDIDKRQGVFIEDQYNYYYQTPGAPPGPDEDAPSFPPFTLPDLFPPADELIGHAEVYAHLCADYTQLAQARTAHGRLAFISGQAGYGRSALARAVAGFAYAQGATVLAVRFWPTARLSQERQLQLWDDDPRRGPQLAATEADLAQAWPDGVKLGGRGWLRLMAQAGVALGTTPTPTRERIPDDFLALGRPLRDLARRGPLVVLIECLDDAPDCWIDLLKHLAPEIIRDWRALLLITVTASRPLEHVAKNERSEVLHLAHTLRRADQAEVYWLGPVTAADVAAFIAPAEAALAERLVTLTGGWPTLIESLWAEWIEAEAVHWDEAAEQWRSAAQPPLVYGDARDQARHWLKLCMGSVSEADLEPVHMFLTCAAQEGPTFTVQAVARALERDCDKMLELCDTLIDKVIPGQPEEEALAQNDTLLSQEDTHIQPEEEALAQRNALPVKEIIPGLLAEVGFVMLENRALTEQPNLYRFAYLYLWLAWRDYPVAGVRTDELQRKLADALEKVYYPQTDLAADALMHLFDAMRQPNRAEPYRQCRQRAADIESLRRHVALLAVFARDDFDQYRLFELRLELSEKLYDAGKYREGADQALAALEAARHWRDELREARAANLAGNNLHAAGDYAAAHPLLERALAIREQALGPAHSHTAASLNNLAGLLQNQSDYAAARPLFERALAIREQALGPAHPDTAQSLNNLAGLLQNQSDYAAARPLFERALAIREQALGPAHPDTAQSLNNLAGLHQAQSDYAAARPLFERALAIREQALGPAHPDTAQSLNNLAGLHHAQGDYAAARPLLERALAIHEQALGPAHPDTAISLNNLALLCYDEGDLAEAARLMRRALDIWERVLGLEHPHTQRARASLARIEARLQE